MDFSNTHLNLYVLLLAGGSSRRMRGQVEDKILAPLGGYRVFEHSLRAFLQCGIPCHWGIVHRDAAQRLSLEDGLRAHGIDPSRVFWAIGGTERADSVRSGLAALPEIEGLVLIHDAARPLVQPETLRQLILLAARDGAACLAHRVTDTIKRAGSLTPSSAPQPTELVDLDRSTLWAMETPQAFTLSTIRKAYACAQGQLTDDAAAYSQAGGRITLLENPHPNPKLTHPTDFIYASALLSALPSPKLTTASPLGA